MKKLFNSQILYGWRDSFHEYMPKVAKALGVKKENIENKPFSISKQDRNIIKKGIDKLNTLIQKESKISRQYFTTAKYPNFLDSKHKFDNLHDYAEIIELQKLFNAYPNLITKSKKNIPNAIETITRIFDDLAKYQNNNINFENSINTSIIQNPTQSITNDDRDLIDFSEQIPPMRTSNEIDPVIKTSDIQFKNKDDVMDDLKFDFGSNKDVSNRLKNFLNENIKEIKLSEMKSILQELSNLRDQNSIDLRNKKTTNNLTTLINAIDSVIQNTKGNPNIVIPRELDESVNTRPVTFRDKNTLSRGNSKRSFTSEEIENLGNIVNNDQNNRSSKRGTIYENQDFFDGFETASISRNSDENLKRQSGPYINENALEEIVKPERNSNRDSENGSLQSSQRNSTQSLRDDDFPRPPSSLTGNNAIEESNNRQSDLRNSSLPRPPSFLNRNISIEESKRESTNNNIPKAPPLPSSNKANGIPPPPPLPLTFTPAGKQTTNINQANKKQNPPTQIDLQAELMNEIKQRELKASNLSSKDVDKQIENNKKSKDIDKQIENNRKSNSASNNPHANLMNEIKNIGNKKPQQKGQLPNSIMQQIQNAKAAKAAETVKQAKPSDEINNVNNTDKNVNKGKNTKQLSPLEQLKQELAKRAPLFNRRDSDASSVSSNSDWDDDRKNDFDDGIIHGTHKKTEYHETKLQQPTKAEPDHTVKVDTNKTTNQELEQQTSNKIHTKEKSKGQSTDATNDKGTDSNRELTFAKKRKMFGGQQSSPTQKYQRRGSHAEVVEKSKLNAPNFNRK